jgi:sphinganine-1-phosphate aldolase
MFLGANGLDPTAFPSLLRMENEIVGLCARHLGGGPEASGSFTSGGTESLILAVKTARDWARVHRPEVVRPEIIVPVTAHASLHKAAHYLDVALVARRSTRTASRPMSRRCGRRSRRTRSC